METQPPRCKKTPGLCLSRRNHQQPLLGGGRTPATPPACNTMCALARGGWRIQHRHCGARGGRGRAGRRKTSPNLFESIGEGEIFSVDESFKILSVATRPFPPLCTEARQNWRKQGIVPRSRDLQPNSAIFHGGLEHFHENGGSSVIAGCRHDERGTGHALTQELGSRVKERAWCLCWPPAWATCHLLKAALNSYDPGCEGRYAYNPRNTKQFA